MNSNWFSLWRMRRVRIRKLIEDFVIKRIWISDNLERSSIDILMILTRTEVHPLERQLKIKWIQTITDLKIQVQIVSRWWDHLEVNWRHSAEQISKKKEGLIQKLHEIFFIRDSASLKKSNRFFDDFLDIRRSVEKWNNRCPYFFLSISWPVVPDAIHWSETKINYQTGMTVKILYLYYKIILIRPVHLHIFTIRIHQSLHYCRVSSLHFLDHIFSTFGIS